MVLGAATTAISIALPILRLSRESIDKVNQKCAEKGLPPAFEAKSSEGDVLDLDINGNPDYRFEGFGLTVGIPIKLAFWIHYKPESPEHVSVGKILVPIQFSEILNVSKILK